MNYDKKLFSLAKLKGWKTPSVDCVLPKESWNVYWKSCKEYEKNPDSGRPVIPHRSA